MEEEAGRLNAIVFWETKRSVVRTLRGSWEESVLRSNSADFRGSWHPGVSPKHFPTRWALQSRQLRVSHWEPSRLHSRTRRMRSVCNTLLESRMKKKDIHSTYLRKLPRFRIPMSHPYISCLRGGLRRGISLATRVLNFEIFKSVRKRKGKENTNGSLAWRRAQLYNKHWAGTPIVHALEEKKKRKL